MKKLVLFFLAAQTMAFSAQAYFAPTDQVKTEQGLVAINHLDPHQRLMVLNPKDLANAPHWHSQNFGQYVHIYGGHPVHLLALNLEDGTHLQVSPNQVFLTSDNTLVPADHLVPGKTLLVKENGSFVKLKTVVAVNYDGNLVAFSAHGKADLENFQEHILNVNGVLVGDEALSSQKIGQSDVPDTMLSLLTALRADSRGGGGSGGGKNNVPHPVPVVQESPIIGRATEDSYLQVCLFIPGQPMTQFPTAIYFDDEKVCAIECSSIMADIDIKFGQTIGDKSSCNKNRQRLVLPKEGIRVVDMGDQPDHVGLRSLSTVTTDHKKIYFGPQNGFGVKTSVGQLIRQMRILGMEGQVGPRGTILGFRFFYDQP